MAQIRKTGRTESSPAVVYDFSTRSPRKMEPEPAGADEAPITENARELHRARQAVDAAPDVRAARVKALRKQVAQGNYHPDPGDIAREMLERGF